jgi:hypothetical protein
MKLSEQEVKGIFFSLTNKNANGVFFGEHPNEMDIQEFANKVAAYIGPHEYMRGKKDEHKRLVKIASEINKDVASVLESKREYAL